MAERVESGPDPDPEIASLQAILVGPAERRLESLQARLDDPERRAADIGEVLPQVLLEHAEDPRFARALTPPLEQAITASVRRNPAPLADALFPVMGPAIRKAVSASLTSMIESLNRTLEHAVSWRSVQWRLEALRTHRPFAEVVLLKTLLYRVEQVFLIDRKSGLLLQHVQPGSAVVADADMVSGMLTAIRDFVHDSFRVAESESLEAMKVGDLSVWIEAGPHAVIAAVIRGTAPRHLRSTLQEAVELIHLQFGHALETFAGDAAPFEAAKPTLESCLASEYHAGERRAPSRFAWILATVVALAFVVWAGFVIRDRLRFSRYVASLSAEPGITIISTARRGGRFVVKGLRDPLAADPATLVAGTGLAPDDVEGQWTAYQALDPPLVLARAERVLQPPAGVTLGFADGVLTANGPIPPAWLAEASRLAPLIGGVERFDRAAATAAAIAGIAERLDAVALLFVRGSATLAANQADVLDRLVTSLAELDAAAAAGGTTIRVELTGHTDAEGPETSNEPLSLARAEAVRTSIAPARLPHLAITTAGLGSRQPAANGRSPEDMQRNRRVTVRVVRPAAAP